MKPAQMLSPNDAAYPALLRSIFGGLLPPDVWYRGNLDVLRGKAVGFSGSRDATAIGREVAADCARQLSGRHVTIISGYAPGIDMAAHESALASGGRTLIVLPEGIDRFRIKKTIEDVWGLGTHVSYQLFSTERSLARGSCDG